MTKVKALAMYDGYEETEDGIEIRFKVNNYRYAHYFRELPTQEMSITLSDPRNKRSNEQNRLLWKLIHEIAENENSHSSDDMEMYCYFLEKCNENYTYISVLAEAVPSLKTQARVVQVLGYEKRSNGTVWAKCRLFLGSSSMNTKEMSKLIDIVLEYAHNLGIDTTYYKELLL